MIGELIVPEVIFNGPEGRIEGRYSPSTKSKSPAALILHPHPLHGGTMNNKVVYNTFKAFANNNFSTLRINFRGVGRSQGQYDQGIGELTDAATAMDWLQLQNPDASNFWVAGFSFGAWIALQLLMRRPEIQGFVAVSPPANKYDFSFLSPCPSAGLIIQGDKDSIVDEESASELADKLSRQKNSNIEYHVIFGADHYFRDKIDELYSTVDNYVKDKVSTVQPKAIKMGRKRKQLISE
jgi:uncharacterized protein